MGGILSAAAPIVGSLISSSASSNAASGQQAAANNATQLQQQIFNTINNQLEPYRSSGYGANAYLASLMGIPVDQTALQQQFMPDYAVNGNITVANAPTTTTGGHNGGGRNAAPTGGYTFKDAAGNIITDQNGNPITLKSLPGGNQPLTAQWLQQQSKAGGLEDWTGLQNALKGEQSTLNNPSTFGSLLKPFDLSQFQVDPGYNFQLQQGEQGINRANAARGDLLSGSALKALGQYDTGLAQQDYSNAFARNTTNQNNLYNRLSGMSNQGMGAVNASGAAGQNYANQASNNMIGAANVGAANTMAQAGMFNQGLAGMMGSSYGGGSGFSSGYNNGLSSQLFGQPQYNANIIWG